MSEVEGSTLFSSLQYYIAGKITPEAQEILDKGAAKSNSYLSELVKISITDTTDNEDEYSEITDIYDIPVVSCDWVILSHKCGKLLPTKPFPPKQTSDQLFANKVFAASHVERSDLDSLWAMITFHGGSTQRSMTENVTHLLCTDTKGKKYGLSENKFKVKVVTSGLGVGMCPG
ncbi:PAXIP1 [Bugula neritina]|uniref:PAXIP1 n=1 Tax=Bugula neritina TaxID=10212 RepID=A0A7J7KG31_BUGNE|nr:PAXIP1 [Bugula neritina]